MGTISSDLGDGYFLLVAIYSINNISYKIIGIVLPFFHHEYLLYV